jgi:transcriptional regulator NrdR family protein
MICPHCNSSDLGVAVTGNTDTYRIRHRRCSNCNQSVKTVEVIVSDDLVRYQAPIVKKVNGKVVRARRGSKLVIVPTSRYMIDHFAKILQNPEPIAS